MLKLFVAAGLSVLTTAALCQTVPPSPDPLKAEIVLERNEKEVWRAIDSRLVLAEGDRVRFRIRTNYGGYLYVTNRNTSGGYDVLFPDVDTGLQNKLDPGTEYIVPAKSGWFRIAGPPGQEVVFWLVSPTPLAGLARRPAPEAGGHSEPSRMTPRCDSSTLRARGDCIDATAGARQLSDTDNLSGYFAGVRNLQSRDLVFIRQNDISIVSSLYSFGGPVIYEFRIAHR